MFYRILAVGGLLLMLCGLQVTAQDAKKDDTKYGLDISVSTETKEKDERTEVIVTAKAVGNPVFPDGSIFSATVSRIGYDLRWKDKMLFRKDKDVLRSLTGQLKGGAFTVKGRVGDPGFYEVEVTYNPIRQRVAKPKDLYKEITFFKQFSIGGVASSIPALEEEIKMFSGEFTGKAKTLIEESSKNVSNQRKWAEKYVGIIDEITALKTQLNGLKGTVFTSASFDVISITTSDFISYLQNFDITSNTALERYTKLSAEGVDVKLLAKDFRSTLSGELADFDYFLNIIKTAKELFAREYTIYILYSATTEVEYLADEYRMLVSKGIDKAEFADIVKEVTESVKSVKAGYEKLNVGDYKSEYTKYKNLVNDMFARLDNLVKAYSTSDELAIKSAKHKLDDLLDSVMDVLEGVPKDEEKKEEDREEKEDVK